MKWLDILTAKGIRLDCYPMQVKHDMADRPLLFDSEGDTRVGAIKTPCRKECLSPSDGGAPLMKEDKDKATRPADVNNIRDVRRGAEIPFVLKGGPDHLGPCSKGILFPPSRPKSTKALLRRAFYAGILRSNAPDLKAKRDRPSRCHSSERSEGYYLKDNSTTETCYMAFESLDKTELEPIISSKSNGGIRIKCQLKVDSKNCLKFNLTCQIRLK